jgi:hypothetical protein
MRSYSGAWPRATYALQVLRLIPRKAAHSMTVHQSVGSSLGSVGVGIDVETTRGGDTISVPAVRLIRVAATPVPAPPGRTPVVDHGGEARLADQQKAADQEHHDRGCGHRYPLPLCRARYRGSSDSADQDEVIDEDQSRSATGPLADLCRTSEGHPLIGAAAVSEREGRSPTGPGRGEGWHAHTERPGPCWST